MNRAIRHSFVVLFVAAVSACATVRAFPEAHAADATPSPALRAQADSVVVGLGDTLYGLASRYGVTTRDLAQWNGLVAPYTIRTGQRLSLKAPATTACAAQPAATVPAATAKAAAVAKTRPALADDTPQWRWPADGVVIAHEVVAGAIEPGIDIVGKAGSIVRSSADGVVLYSGAGSPGYEELIVVRHANGWVSSYSHNRRLLVGEGQMVKAGTPIAEMGSAGTTRDMLHFELRRDGALLDPLRYLPRR